MSLNKEKAVQEYLEYLYGDVIDDEMYAPEVFQSRKDFLAGYKAGVDKINTLITNNKNDSKRN